MIKYLLIALALTTSCFAVSVERFSLGEWVEIHNTDDSSGRSMSSYTHIMRVVGGWIMQTEIKWKSVTSVFIADENYIMKDEWKVK